MSTITVNGIRVHYQRLGDHGPPIVFLHGWASSWRIWERTARQLAARRYRCYALDLPGFGDSDKPPDGWYTIPNFTALVRGFCRACGLERAIVAGHSMGGMIALNLALRSPGAVGGLILADVPIGGSRSLLLRLVPDWPLAQRVFAGWQNWGRPTALSYLTIYHDVRAVDGVALQRNFEDVSRASPTAVLSSLRAIGHTDLRPRLGDVGVPTLVVAGANDLLVPVRQARLLCEELRNARLHILPRTGHLPMDERPEEFDRLVSEFLREVNNDH